MQPTTVREMALQEINHRSKIINDHLDDMYTVVTLQDFENKALPLLVERGKDFDLPAWVEIVGHPRVGLRVLDVDGSVKYEIPAFAAELESHDNHGIDCLSSAANHFSHIRSSGAIQAIAMLNRAMKEYEPNKSEEEFKKESDNIAEIFNKIYDDYNLPDLKIELFSTGSTSSNSTEQQESISTVMDDEYDEL